MIKNNKAFIRAGAALLLLKPRSKAPVGEDWSEAPVATFDELNRRCKGHNVGVRLGKWSKMGDFYLHVLDVDIRSDQHESEARAKLAEILMGYDYEAFPRVKSGSGGASFHVYFVTDKPFKSKKLAHSDGFSHVFDKSKRKKVKKWDWEIELFGTGKQVAIPPSIHPETGNEYAWEVEFDPTADYPLVESTDIEVLVAEPQAEIGADEQTGISYDDAEKFLKGLDTDYWCEDREGWIKVGMALHHEFDGAKDAFDVWCDFARQSKKFDLREHKSQWRSFKNRGSRPTTFRTVIEAAHESEWAATYDELPDMFDDIDDIDDKPASGDIADEFDDLPPLEDARESKPKAPAKPRKGDPDVAFLDYSNIPAPKLPLDILSPRLQKIVRDGAINSGAPDDYVFAAILTGASMCLGNSVRVNLKRGYEQPAILWTQIIGGPSTKKSPAMRVVINCLTAIEKRMMVPYLARKEQWDREAELAAAYLKDWETKRKARIAAGEEVESEAPANCKAPEKPAEPLLLMSDQTIEAFYRRQKATPRGFGIVRDELAAFLADMERYDNSNRASWLESYDGGFHRVERVKDNGDIITIPHICAPIMGGIQPERLMDIVALSTTDDGLQARFMPFWPDRVQRNFFDEADGTEDLERVLERLATIPMEKDENGNPTPFWLNLTPKAHKVYGDWSNEAEARDLYVDDRLKGVYGKVGGQVGRLALVIEHLNWGADDFSDEPPTEVGVAAVKAAIRFREEYLRPMQKRVHDFASETSESSVARRIANHIIEEKYDIVNARELRRKSGVKGVNSHTLSEVVDEAIAFLVEKRWLFPVEQERNQKGGRPKKDFKVNPRLRETVRAKK